MIDPKIIELTKIASTDLTVEDFAFLQECAKCQMPNISDREWEKLILSVYEIITSRENREKALKFVEESYNEYSRKFPTSFKGRQQIQQALCMGYIELGNQQKAHEAMNRYVFVSLAEIGFNSPNEKMTYFSFRPFSDYSLADIREEKISFAHPREFNDPLDTILVYWLNKTIDNQHIVSENELKYTLLLKKVSENIKLRCLIGSRYKDKDGVIKSRSVEDLSFLMWSHYAKSHTGFCVEYSFQRDLFENDAAERKIQLIESVSYPELIKIEEIPSFTRCLFEKSNFWEYEHEMRFVQFDSNMPAEGNNIDYPTISCKNMIRAVYLGVNCSDSDRLRMLKAIGDKDIPLYQMVIDDNNVTRFSKVQIG